MLALELNSEAEPALNDERSDFLARFSAIKPSLQAMCAAVVGADDAEDLVSDTYVRAWERRGQLRDWAKFDAWVFRIALNNANALIRSRHRQAVYQQAVRSDVASGRDIGLQLLVEGLPPRERAVLVLHYGYGYSMREVAHLLGLLPVTVRVSAWRARRRLRDQMTQEDAP
jgi:RNA polymerase sigma factor (sigma-70 family)